MKQSNKASRQWMRWMGVAAVAALMSGTAFAAATGITTTKHNLSSGGPGNTFSGTDQICVFCHTPHGSDSSGPAPLWNRTLPAAAGYTTYDTLGTQSLDGKMLKPGAISLACLSCHDGSQALNTVLNAPGTGTTNAAWTAGTWTAGASGMGGGISGGKLTGVVMLGTDLTNDHPIGIEYCGGGVTTSGAGAFTASTCNDTDFINTSSQNTTSDGRTADLTVGMIGTGEAVWIDLGGAGRQKTDIPLYVRDFSASGGSASGPSVECASCHDPHVAAVGVNNVAFMRVTASGSQICLSCHIK